MFIDFQILAGILLTWVLLLSATSPPALDSESDSVFNITLPSLDDEMIDIGSLTSKQAIVFVFLSPECPLCKTYTATLNDFCKRYQDNNIALFGIVPGKNYSTSDVEKYNRKYKLKFKILLEA